MKIPNFIYRFFSILLLLTFFVTIISAFFFKRFSYGDHSFNVPAFFGSFLFLSIFVVFTFKPTSGNPAGKTTVQGFKKILASFLILAITVVCGYFGIYLPFRSHLISEVAFTEPTQINIDINPKDKYYMELDISNYAYQSGSIVTISASSSNWSDSKKIIVGKKNTSPKNLNSSGTETFFLPFNFPEAGKYTITLSKEDHWVSIQRVRFFEER